MKSIEEADLVKLVLRIYIDKRLAIEPIEFKLEFFNCATIIVDKDI